MTIKNTNPIHPGKVLEAIYMAEMALNQSALARQIGCSPRKINEIIRGKRGISAEFSLELERVLGTSAEMWVRMQAEYDLFEARKRSVA